MQQEQPQKLDTSSEDIMGQNLEKLKELFPSVVKDGTVDVEALRNVIGDISEPNQEYYNFTWAGKSDAFKIIKEKSHATLKPQKSDDESVDFENTENIFIEGDNLEVLKILQKTYHNAIKMIYIDPPYNKDKDFVYPDRWSEGLATYLEYSKLVDEDGNITSSSAEDKIVKAGRKHSQWLTMMYPRLFLARNLLTDDGVIFISIDDNEVKNLKMICDEIFGEENFVNEFAWRRTDNQSNIGNSAKVKDYILCYSKSKTVLKFNKMPLSKKAINEYSYQDDIGKFRRKNILDKSRGKKRYNIKAPNGEILDGPWMVEEDEFNQLNLEGKIYWADNRMPYGKKYLHEADGQIISDWLDKDFGTNQRASNEIEELFKTRAFDFPKPTKLIKTFVTIGTNNNDIILDFFAGSGTTAHSVISLNAEDGGKRKCISVQLPEHLDKKEQKESIKFLNSIGKPTNLAEITKERIRRASVKITEENPDVTFDAGFKVFKLSESNFKQWDDSPKSKEELTLAFDEYKDNVKDGSKQLDMLYEVILAKGLSLNSTIEEIEINGKNMLKVDSDGVELLACFEEEITKEALDRVVDLRPIYFICLDSSFKSDSSLKTNSVLNFKDADILFETV